MIEKEGKEDEEGCDGTGGESQRIEGENLVVSLNFSSKKSTSRSKAQKYGFDFIEKGS